MSNEIEPTEIVALYRVWTSIVYRCTRTDNKQYKNYGGRGIFLCEEWMDFNNFVRDVGKRPFEGCHLDRTDNDKGYSKENCRWTTPKINHRNKRNNRYYETSCGKICQSELIERMGFTRTQFKRAVEKHGIDSVIRMFDENKIPPKKKVVDLADIVGRKFGKLTLISVDRSSKTGPRYNCVCECGYRSAITRFKCLNGLATECKSCARKGDKNPKRKHASKSTQ